MSLVFGKLLGRKCLLEWFEKYPICMCHCARLTGIYKNIIATIFDKIQNFCYNFIVITSVGQKKMIESKKESSH